MDWLRERGWECCVVGLAALPDQPLSAAGTEEEAKAAVAAGDVGISCSCVVGDLMELNLLLALAKVPRLDLTSLLERSDRKLSL